MLSHMDKKPTPEGAARYPQHGLIEDGYYIADSGAHLPCTCSPDCADECEGECGCVACQRAVLDILHGE